MAIGEKHLTLEEFLELPERKPAFEFEDGVVTRKMSPKGKHSALQAELVELLNRAAREGRQARAFTELRTTFAGASPVPDISVYRWKRIPRDDKGRIADDFSEPPDVAIEIVSPKQSVNQLIRRCLRFVENGVSAALLVDPVDESITVFRPGAEARALRGTDKLELSQVIPGLELTPRELFASLYER